MESGQAKVPDSDAIDWKAIDIFVFSNGQQYSPPRKYHLRTEDLNWWKSTLNFMARTQYGISQSYIDLYTTDGKKIESPLELRNGSPYVAVAPHDRFIDTGYDKYLIRASRSWEKRQAKKLSVTEPEMTHTETANLTIKVEDRLQEGSMDLKTIVPSIVDHETSIIVQPQQSSAIQRKNEPLHVTPAKISEKKRSSIQKPTIPRRITPPAPPVPNMKTSLKKRDSIKSGNVKMTRPDGERNSFSAAGNSQVGKIAAKTRTSKPTTTPKESSIVPKVLETERELKSSSSVKITNKNDTNLLNNNVFIKNVMEDKEKVLVSNIYQNPRRDLPSVAVDPNEIQNIGAVGNHTLIAIPVEHLQTAKPKDEINLDIRNKEINIDTTCKLVNDSSPPRNFPTNMNNITDVRTNGKGPTVKEHINMNMETKTDDINKENAKINNSPPQRLSIVSNILTQDQHSIQGDGNNVDKRTHNIHSASTPEQLSTKITNVQYITHKIIHNDEEYVDLNKEVSGSALKNIKTQNITSTLHDEPLGDGCVAVLNKGDVVNLKLNIEIENCDGGLIKIRDNTNLHPITNVQRPEKGSQINIANQMVAHNKSLMSLIAKEISDRHIGDNHFFIIVQCSGCKYCNDKIAAISDTNVNKNYMILLPVSQFQDKRLRCYCDQSHEEVRRSSIFYPVKATISCMSVQRLTKLKQTESAVETNSKVIATPDPKPNDNVLQETDMSNMDTIIASEKKSIAIHKVSVPISRQSSKISYEINVKNEFVAVSKEHIAVQHKPILDNSSQTNWCDVLLEARVLEDGHYTFRLPPLEVLKYYKLV